MNKTAPCNFYHAGQQGKSLNDYKHFRLYSHVIDEYDFKINNKLMVEKIINPRRDKIIMDSLIHASPKYILRKKKILPANEKQSINRRNGVEKKGLKRSLLCNDQLEQTQLGLKKAQKWNIVPYESVGSALESNVEFTCLSQTKNIINSENLEARDGSLRNNYVGRIIKNTRRQCQWQASKVLSLNFHSNIFRLQKNLLVSQFVDKNGKSELIINNSGRIKQNYRKKSYKSRFLHRQRDQQMKKNQKRLQSIKEHEFNHAY